MKIHRFFLMVAPLAIGALVSVSAGCKDKRAIKQYQVSKDEPAPPAIQPMGAMPATEAAPAGNPVQITGKAPEGWAAQPLSSMRQASYLVKGDGGATADISLVLLAGPAGGVLDNINRWLSQLGKPAITADGLANIAQKVITPIGEATVVDLEGLPTGGDPAKDGRIVAGIVSGDGGSYFFKMRGNAALAESQKAAFISWISSVKKSEGSAPLPALLGALPESPSCPVVGPDGKGKPPMAPGASAPAPGALPSAPAECPAAGATPAAASVGTPPSTIPPDKVQIKWEVPANWKTVPPTAMRFASFEVAGSDGESGDISVSTFSGDGGGDLENVNRWRTQAGLEPIDAAGLKANVVPVACKEGKIFTVDMAGPKTRILAGWARVGGQSWFFKFTGPDRLAEGAKPAFFQFLQSVQFQPSSQP